MELIKRNNGTSNNKLINKLQQKLILSFLCVCKFELH